MKSSYLAIGALLLYGPCSTLAFLAGRRFLSCAYAEWGRFLIGYRHHWRGTVLWTLGAIACACVPVMMVLYGLDVVLGWQK